jgi:hypothetical protein
MCIGAVSARVKLRLSEVTPVLILALPVEVLTSRSRSCMLYILAGVYSVPNLPGKYISAVVIFWEREKKRREVEENIILARIRNLLIVF